MKSKKNPEIVVTALICFGLMMLVLWAYYSAVFGKKEPEQKKEISVVLYYAGNDGWESLMEGMRQAEEDFAVNINYVMVKEGMTKEEQTELVRQEVEKGAQGILLAAMDATVMPQEFQGENVQVPVIVVESSVDAAAYPFFSADNTEMGRMLGRELLTDFADKESIKVAVVEEFMERDSVRDRAAGLREVLSEGVEFVVLQRENKEEELPVYLERAIKGMNIDAVVALSKEPLQVLGEMQIEVLVDKKVYGIGNTASTVAALDKGRVEKLVFQNEFNIGYLSVEALVKESISFLKEHQSFSPKIILIAPPVLGEDMPNSCFADEFDAESVAKSYRLAEIYEQIAKKYQCAFLNAAMFAPVSSADSLHLSAESHAAFASSVYECIINLEKII